MIFYAQGNFVVYPYEQGDQLFFAIFTDELENVSKHYRAEDIKFKLEVAEKNGWKVNFFCRYGDKLFYQSRLNIPNKRVVGITLDIDGMRVMENRIQYKLTSMVQKQKTQNQ